MFKYNKFTSVSSSQKLFGGHTMSSASVSGYLTSAGLKDHFARAQWRKRDAGDTTNPYTQYGPIWDQTPYTTFNTLSSTVDDPDKLAYGSQSTLSSELALFEATGIDWTTSGSNAYETSLWSGNGFMVAYTGSYSSNGYKIDPKGNQIVYGTTANYGNPAPSSTTDQRYIGYEISDSSRWTITNGGAVPNSEKAPDSLVWP